jgi:hypothetical protein
MLLHTENGSALWAEMFAFMTECCCRQKTFSALWLLLVVVLLQLLLLLLERMCLRIGPGRQTDRQAEIHANKQTDRRFERLIHTHTCRNDVWILMHERMMFGLMSDDRQTDR